MLTNLSIFTRVELFTTAITIYSGLLPSEHVVEISYVHLRSVHQLLTRANHAMLHSLAMFWESGLVYPWVSATIICYVGLISFSRLSSLKSVIFAEICIL